MGGFCCFSEGRGEIGGESGTNDGGSAGGGGGGGPGGVDKWALAFADAMIPFMIDSRRFGGKGGGALFRAIFCDRDIDLERREGGKMESGRVVGISSPAVLCLTRCMAIMNSSLLR